MDSIRTLNQITYFRTKWYCCYTRISFLVKISSQAEDKKDWCVVVCVCVCVCCDDDNEMMMICVSCELFIASLDKTISFNIFPFAAQHHIYWWEKDGWILWRKHWTHSTVLLYYIVILLVARNRIHFPF